MMHPTSLSRASWEYIKQMPWNRAKTQAIKDELLRDYESGEWASKMGAQINKRILNREELQSVLDLDPKKKTAVLFPHLFWDATFFYGRDLFRDYEDWFVQSVRVAVNNPALNWVIKVHPANISKRHRDGYKGEYSEIVAVQKHVGVLPAHIKLVSAESDVSTFSFYSVMDYCLTVRGTVGIEAGVFGIPVLTAGTGRYDHLGFTIDSETPAEYLDRLTHLQEQPPLTRTQQELAQRFAYGILMMRPFHLQSVSLEFEKDTKATAKSHFNVGTVRELVEAEDMCVFVKWVSDLAVEDCLSEA
jgi:capsule polysaccharide export protein KpsC/LpsZ